MDAQVPVSARSSIDQRSESSQGPIPLFDAHLKFIDASYLAFFQERKRIEETYIESLKKLHRKIRASDAQLDDRTDLSTTRAAWSEVVENVERETQARQAFCITLTSEVINPLITLKETQSRTRERIKEDIKGSTIAYTEYAEAMLPKLKKQYTKKYNEVEEQKRTNALPQLAPAISPPDIHPSSSNPNARSHPHLPPQRPSVTGPQPLRALDRRPSASVPRNRSPSSSGAFSDLAHHGKNQLNQFIGGFLDKRGVKEGGRETQALRTVRAKREADDANKEYRKGVHWLETLRLRRTKILESGYKSLEMLVEESAIALKKVLERYTDHLTATYSTQCHLSTHARSVVDRIAPERDLLRLRANIPRSLASAIPEPTLYEHGQVGECNDLIFGFSLADYATAKGLPEGEIPKIVRLCITEIDKRGLDSEGIYRVSGRHAVVQALQHDIEKDEDDFRFMPKDDIFAVASLLKLYLRELPEPLFKFPWQDRVQHTENRAEHLTNNFVWLRAKIRRLPVVHQATLRALIEHLARVVSHTEKNKMDPKNVSIVFGGVIFGDDDIPKGGDLMSMQLTKDTVMEDLITNVQIIFGEQDQQPLNNSPPLPPTPISESPMPQFYGSKSTKVKVVSRTPSGPNSPQDFTPRLPPRPANSIHPSARNNTNSPTKPRLDSFPQQIQKDLSVDKFSIPPSPSEISSSLDTDGIVLHSREGSSGSERQEKRQSASRVTPPVFPFPSRSTPEGSPRPTTPANNRQPRRSGAGPEDPF